VFQSRAYFAQAIFQGVHTLRYRSKKEWGEARVRTRRIDYHVHESARIFHEHAEQLRQAALQAQRIDYYHQQGQH
jgi:hypothetical protein